MNSRIAKTGIIITVVVAINTMTGVAPDPSAVVDLRGLHSGVGLVVCGTVGAALYLLRE